MVTNQNGLHDVTRFQRIQASVPAGVVLPDALRRLCDYLDETDYPISGCMRLRPDDYGGLLAWFDGDAAMAAQFACFGAGPDGSLIAFWLLSDTDALQAPVVHLDSEASNNRVLAKNFEDFLLLFGIGYDELGFADLNQPPDDPGSAENLRAWLQSEFDLTCPATGASIVEEANRACPDIQHAIDAWLRNRYGEET